MSNQKQQKTPLHYSRKKDAVEISGDPADVRKLAWFDMITSKALWIAAFIFLFLVLPKASFLPLIWQWLKGRLFLIPLLVPVDSLLLFSG